MHEIILGLYFIFRNYNIRVQREVADKQIVFHVSAHRKWIFIHVGWRGKHYFQNLSYAKLFATKLCPILFSSSLSREQNFARVFIV